MIILIIDVATKRGDPSRDDLSFWRIIALLFFTSRQVVIFMVENKRSPVAQSVEQVAVNHSVAGSNPARGAVFLSW